MNALAQVRAAHARRAAAHARRAAARGRVALLLNGPPLAAAAQNSREGLVLLLIHLHLGRDNDDPSATR